MKTKKSTTDPCPCGGASYAACCQPLHQGQPAPNAEALMRSRYSAYVLKLESYLFATWHAATRPAVLELEADTVKWLGLEVKSHRQQEDSHATVEFVARYKNGGRAQRLHEISRFVREGDAWLYVDGLLRE